MPIWSVWHWCGVVFAMFGFQHGYFKMVKELHGGASVFCLPIDKR